MPLDVPTLFVLSTAVTGLLGLFLLFLWIKDRSVPALGWWGLAYLIGGTAVALWSLQLFGVLTQPRATIDAPLFLACGLIWKGARAFHGRRTPLLAVFAGGFIWFAACQFIGLPPSSAARVALGSLIISTYIVLTATELCRDRRNSQASRWRRILIPALHGAVFLSPILLAAKGGTVDDAWFALFALQTLLYVVGTAFMVVVLASERVQMIHKTAAATDPLSGLFNRRGFLDAAAQILARQAKKKEMVTMLMFDLDRFKSINDRFGHAVGDDALRLFATTASTKMRLHDVIGRLGGEEFAAIIPGGIDIAAGVAERVRLAFEAVGAEFSGHRVGATVSVGAAAVAAHESEIHSLMARADSALYAAKTGGRNRLAVDGEPDVAARPPEHTVAAKAA
ncbi:MAG: diguanylate cyclase [Rhizobiales bacterium]|nr:diguanylate cyclase [Hyphomicrobiales bacterium]